MKIRERDAARAADAWITQHMSTCPSRDGGMVIGRLAGRTIRLGAGFDYHTASMYTDGGVKGSSSVHCRACGATARFPFRERRRRRRNYMETARRDNGPQEIEVPADEIEADS